MDHFRDLPLIDSLWDFNDPAHTERLFRDLLPRVQVRSGYHIELLTQLARAQGLQRHFDAAHATLDHAEAMLTPDLTRAWVRVLLERGRVFNSSQNVAAAYPLFLEALTLAEAQGEENLAVDAAHMLAIVAPLDYTVKWNEHAIQMAEASTDPQARRWLGSLYNNLGWTYHGLGEFGKALDLFQRAVAFRLAEGDIEKTRIARWCVARCLRSLGYLDEALTIQRTLEREDSGDGYVHEELGELLLAQGDSDAARPYFARAYERLSKDIWLVANEGQRLERLKSLGEGEI